MNVNICGGDEVLSSAAGKNETDDLEDVCHSSNARAMTDEFYASDINTSSIPTKTKCSPPKQPHYNLDKTIELVVKLLRFLVPLIILGIAVGIRFYTRSSSQGVRIYRGIEIQSIINLYW
ncbi:cytochrome b5-like [Cornus florida]|uniref:cytochrome b5-like n=1 Tax=Cornus florida TaxID=4283 RepID=UPI0028A2A963|nr:cytochrome b5-like [Cornus florida]